MAQGYYSGSVHTLIDKDLTPQQFIARYARNYGALASILGGPSDEPLPDKIEVPQGNLKLLEAAKQELKELSGLTESERLTKGEELKQDQIQRYTKLIATTRKELDKIARTIEAINQLSFPRRLAGMKADMLKELDSAKGGIGLWQQKLKKVEELDPVKLYVANLAQTVRAIEVYADAYKRDVQNAAQDNKWLADLKAMIATIPDEEQA